MSTSMYLRWPVWFHKILDQFIQSSCQIKEIMILLKRHFMDMGINLNSVTYVLQCHGSLQPY